MAGTRREMLALVGEGFRYPSPGQAERLEAGLASMPAGVEKQAFERFLSALRRLPLSEREELHTRTLDLDPPAAPYVGFQAWGESYQRGNFMAALNRALMETGIETEGELPDHLIPVLRYLARVADPLPELVAVLVPALRRMHAGLREADAHNPYLDLLDAAQLLCQDMAKEKT